MGYTGRCACGAITLRIDGEPITTRQCWCRQCQQLGTGGPTHNAMFKAEDVAIEGALASSSWQAASGNTLTFHFCPGCGTHVYAQSTGRLHIRTVRFGVLDQPHGLKPQVAIWTDEAPAWAQIDPRMERWPQQPPPPPPPAD